MKTLSPGEIFEKDQPWEHTEMPKETVPWSYRPVDQIMEVPLPGILLRSMGPHPEP